MTSLYLGGLPASISHRELLRHLEIYGRVNALNIQRGYAFVEYDSDADAKDVVANFADKPFMGHASIQIDFAKRPRRQFNTAPTSNAALHRDHTDLQPRQESAHIRYPVVVNNLHPRTCWQELKDFGRMAGGTVVFCDIDRTHRNRGFLEYYTQEDADNFIKEGNGKELLGNPIQLCSLGQRKLLPEHGPNSRSPPHTRSRRFSPSLSSFTRHGCSRSRSPRPSRQYGHAIRSSRIPRRSSVPPPLASSRYDDEQPRCVNDRDDYHEQYSYSPMRCERYPAQSTPKTEAQDFQLNTGYYRSGDYIDLWTGRDPHTDKMEAQWMEYSGVYHHPSS